MQTIELIKWLALLHFEVAALLALISKAIDMEIGVIEAWKILLWPLMVVKFIIQAVLSIIHIFTAFIFLLFGIRYIHSEKFKSIENAISSL